jgi:chromosomal replication initiator protein
LDGPAVVNGILSIPLGGRSTASGSNGSAQASSAHGLREFVTGAENRLAVVALGPYLERAATDFSPLVLYGPRGVGKSHLARGLADWWHQRHGTSSVNCLGGSEFAQRYAAAVQQHRLEAWRSELAESALLVLDDVGQLAGKRPAQQELAQLLDELADRQALVVVTARGLPNHSAVLLPALRSRLSAGLSVPLSLPGPATRRAILERLAAARGISLSRRTIQGLADGLAAGVPALAAALAELERLSRETGQAIDDRGVQKLVRQSAGDKAPSVRQIASLTAKYFGLTIADLKSPKRRQPLVAGRAVAMYLARQLIGSSFERIGTYFGNRDHTTVLHSCRRVENLLARDRATRQAVSDLKRLLHAG